MTSAVNKTGTKFSILKVPEWNRRDVPTNKRMHPRLARDLEEITRHVLSGIEVMVLSFTLFVLSDIAPSRRLFP